MAALEINVGIDKVMKYEMLRIPVYIIANSLLALVIECIYLD